MIFRIQRNWKRWFAWFPVELESGDRAWLTFVERRHYQSGFDRSYWWIYRDRQNVAGRKVTPAATGRA